MDSKKGKEKRTRSVREGEAGESVESGEEKQIKIDSLLPQVSKTAERETNLDELMKVINSFETKLNTLVSKDFIEKSLKKVASKDFVQEKFEALKEELGKEIRGEIDKVNTQVNQLNDKVLQSVNDIEELKNIQSDIDVKVQKIEEENKALKQRQGELKDLLIEREVRLKVHELYINNLEQYTRKNSVRIYGVEDMDRDETQDQSQERIIKLANDKLGVKLTKSDIDIAHRMGRFSASATRPVICKFVSRSVKIAVLKARRQLKGSPIVIREDLTMKNAKLLETVSAKEEVVNAWSDDGKIIGVLVNGKKMRFDLSSDLSRRLVSAEELKMCKDRKDTDID